MARRRRNIFAPRESLIQQAVLDHWKALQVPGSLVAAVPNARAAGQAGLTRGLFDLVVMSPTLGDRTGWLELKADDGKLSEPQNAFKLLMIARGVPYAVTYGRDQPIKILELWGAVRPQISQINSSTQGEALHGRAWSGEAKLGAAWRRKARLGKDISSQAGAA
jgi:hypothetical protein